MAEEELKVSLSDKQLKGLEILSEMDSARLLSETSLTPKCSWVGRAFQWIDDNILSKTSRLWMYLLEIVGLVCISIILSKVDNGLLLISEAKTELDIQKAKMYVDALIQLAPALASMIATICGALPLAIGAFRSLKSKWELNSNKEEVV